jgi:RNA polymerase sigma-70 factor (ECF subfamily)
MNTASTTSTRVSLLQRIRANPQDQKAWEELVSCYGPPIYQWCRQRQLQEADAQDVTQTVLTRLAVRMRTFVYDPAQSFRAYLKTLTYYAWCDFLESRNRPGIGSGNSAELERLHMVEAREDLIQHLEASFDLEVLEEAMRCVQQRVEPRTWEAFRLTALEGLGGAAVAERLGMKVASVFKAKSNVQKLLREEKDRLEKTWAS